MRSLVPDPAGAGSDTKGRILQAALELFSEHGFDGTTLQQIADRLGVTKAALYYHFRSKDDLLEALVVPAVTGMEELLTRYEQAPAAPGQRRRFLTDYVDYLLAHRPLIAYMSSDLAILVHPALSIGSRDRRARLERQLGGAELAFPERVRLTLAFRGIGGVIAQYPDADTAELRQALLDALQTLLRPPRRRAQPSASDRVAGPAS